MPEPFGSASKTYILKSESHKLHEEFEVDALKATITLSTDLVNLNVVNGKVNNKAIAPVTFATDHDASMVLLAAAIEALGTAANVADASVTAARVITVTAYDSSLPLVLHEFATTGGASAATYTYASDNNRIYKGQPVKLTTSGKIEPYAAGDIPGKLIGYAEQDGFGGDLVTVMMKAFAIIYAEAYADGHVPGVCRMAAFNSTTKMMEVDDGGTLDHTTIIGNCLDSGDNGDVVRVAVF